VHIAHCKTPALLLTHISVGLPQTEGVAQGNL